MNGTSEANGASATKSQPQYVRLISNDNFEFVVRRQAALCSGMIRRILEPGAHAGFKETATNTVEFKGADGISGIVLEKVCEYMYYNERNKDRKDVPDQEIPAELCLQLLMAADYLEL